MQVVSFREWPLKYRELLVSAWRLEVMFDRLSDENKWKERKPKRKKQKANIAQRDKMRAKLRRVA